MTTFVTIRVNIAMSGTELASMFNYSLTVTHLIHLVDLPFLALVAVSTLIIIAVAIPIAITVRVAVNDWAVHVLLY